MNRRSLFAMLGALVAAPAAALSVTQISEKVFTFQWRSDLRAFEEEMIPSVLDGTLTLRQAKMIFADPRARAWWKLRGRFSQLAEVPSHWITDGKGTWVRYG